MPTNRKVKRVLFQKISALSVNHIVDMGAGWGHLAIPLACRFPKIRVVAIELSPVPCGVLLFLKWILHLRNLEVRWANFHSVSLRDVDCVVCYLFPKAMERLEKKFEKELRNGSCVLTNTFALPTWRYESKESVDDLFKTPVYLYLKE